MTGIEEELRLIDARRERWRKLYRKNAALIKAVQEDNSWGPSWTWIFYGFHVYRDSVEIHKCNEYASVPLFGGDRQPEFAFGLHYSVEAGAAIGREFERQLGEWHMGRQAAIRQGQEHAQRTMELYRKAGLI